MKRFLVFVVLVALFVAGLYRWSRQRQPVRQPEKFTPAESVKIGGSESHGLLARDQELTGLVESVVPSVVSITTSRRVQQQQPAIIDPFEQFFGRRLRIQPREQIQNSLGSGVIVSREGHILTNNHVIAEMDEIKVQLSDGRVFPAKIIGTDGRSDIAVLKIDARDLKPLPLGDSDQVKVGQLVMAIGNPFGLDESVSMGIISAKGRRAADDSANEFFQTDTAINPGNSGGPLVDVRGQIIGINSSIYSGSGGWQGIGFAIPSNTARRTLESLIKNGRVVRGYLGVVIQQLTPELARQFGVQDGAGALVTDITAGSPAEKAGIKSRDIIRKFNGNPIKDIQELRSRVAEAGVGSKVDVVVTRDGTEMTLSIEIVEQPAGYGSAIPPRQQAPSPSPGTLNLLSGLRVSEIPADHRGLLPENIKGVLIVSIDPDAPGARSLQPGDVIEEINRQPVAAVSDFEKIARELPPAENQVLVFLCRGRARSFVVIMP